MQPTKITSLEHYSITMWMLLSKQNSHRQPANFISLHCVAFFFERLLCFNKIKKEITHSGSFKVKCEAL